MTYDLCCFCSCNPHCLVAKVSVDRWELKKQKQKNRTTTTTKKTNPATRSIYSGWLVGRGAEQLAEKYWSNTKKEIWDSTPHRGDWGGGSAEWGESNPWTFFFSCTNLGIHTCIRREACTHTHTRRHERSPLLSGPGNSCVWCKWKSS